MENQVIEGEDYSVRSDNEKNTVIFSGELSLGGPKEYQPIKQLLESIAEKEPNSMTINLKKLSFLNSSGISMLSKFVISLRKKTRLQLIVLGSEEIPWQKKSLKNLQKFLPGLKLEIS